MGDKVKNNNKPNQGKNNELLNPEQNTYIDI